MMFLVSAFAKAWDGEAFADMMLQYGPEWFSVGAPIIIGIEAVLGMCLLMRFHPSRMAWIADLFLVMVSVIFAYGVLVKGIEDCGCFGVLSRLYTSKPWVTFARNIIFGIISIPAILDRDDAQNRFLNWKLVAAMSVAVIACFICGLSMRASFELPKMKAPKTQNRVETLQKLKAIYPFDRDSFYVVYLFSFSCVHCQNSFANVQQYQQFEMVDKVLGIAIEDKESQERFERIYKPEIEIKTISQNEMASITGSLPICLLIREDSIRSIEAGSVTSPGIFIK